MANNVYLTVYRKNRFSTYSSEVLDRKFGLQHRFADFHEFLVDFYVNKNLLKTRYITTKNVLVLKQLHRISIILLYSLVSLSSSEIPRFGGPYTE